ncbi:hypothetical protein ACFUAC_21425 [Streptomyces sp. NPDC057148]|uniref:nSTAND1 domain-containing NTPase n=1 Tax=unclassified Streptomyces TaxID=2593676 RepID=UPI0036321A1D
MTLAYVRACNGPDTHWERRWHATAAEVAALPAGRNTDDPSPYRGLARFGTNDSDLFFGRGPLVKELVDLTHEHRFVALVGASGSGKSSLLRAGLVPALRTPRGRCSAPGRLDYLTAPDGKKTDFDYNNNGKCIKTVYPGGTIQTVTIDDNGRPQRIKTTSGTQTFVDLSYDYASAGKDTTKIRTRTDNLTKLKTSYTYDSQDRLSYALEANAAGARKASWLYCFDKAGNLTSRDGSKSTCPGGTTYTYNDASELTGKNGSTTGWSYDKLGNETGAAGNAPVIFFAVLQEGRWPPGPA